MGIDWEAYAPPGTSIGIRIRAIDGTGNPTGDWIPNTDTDGKAYFDYPGGNLQDSIDLSAYSDKLQTGHVQIEVLLTTNDRKIKPILHSVDISWDYDVSCGGVS